jgi:hypothetical protein
MIKINSPTSLFNMASRKCKMAPLAHILFLALFNFGGGYGSLNS